MLFNLENEDFLKNYFNLDRDDVLNPDEGLVLGNLFLDEYVPYKNYKPYYLIFTDDINAIRNVSLIKKILKYKKNLGFSILMFNDRLSTLPSETTTFINIDEPQSGLVTNDLSEDNQKQFTAEINNDIDVYECAQKLANVPINVEKAKYELPTSLSFLEMYGVGKVEQLNISEKTVRNHISNAMQKLSVKGRAQAVVELLRLNEITL